MALGLDVRKQLGSGKEVPPTNSTAQPVLLVPFATTTPSSSSSSTSTTSPVRNPFAVAMTVAMTVASLCSLERLPSTSPSSFISLGSIFCVALTPLTPLPEQTTGLDLMYVSLAPAALTSRP